MNQTTSTEATAVRGCLEVCRRCHQLVDELETSSTTNADEVYRMLGPHLRHCLDHFSQLFKGLDDGLIDYDTRDRDESLERNPNRFKSALADAMNKLQSVGADELHRPIQVLQQAAIGVGPTPLDSTLERELVFLSSHTIHHLALMVQLAASRGVEVSEALGVAFSTAAYRATPAGAAT
jgi:hypothetical protein